MEKLFKTMVISQKRWKKSSAISDHVVTRVVLVTKKNPKRSQVLL